MNGKLALLPGSFVDAATQGECDGRVGHRLGRVGEEAYRTPVYI